MQKVDFFLKLIKMIIAAVAVKLLPCVILTVISLCLINALYEVNRRKRLLKGYNACGDCSMPERRVTKAERRAERTTRMLVAVLLLFLITEFPQGTFPNFIISQLRLIYTINIISDRASILLTSTIYP